MTNKPQTDQQPENVELLSAQAPITNFRGLMIAIVATIISVVLYQILPYDENVNKGLTILAFPIRLFMSFSADSHWPPRCTCRSWTGKSPSG